MLLRVRCDLQASVAVGRGLAASALLRIGVAAVVQLVYTAPDKDDRDLGHVVDVAVVFAKALRAVAAAIAVGTRTTGSGAKSREVSVIQSSAVHVAELHEAKASRVSATVMVQAWRMTVQHGRARVYLVNLGLGVTGVSEAGERTVVNGIAAGRVRDTGQSVLFPVQVAGFQGRFETDENFEISFQRVLLSRSVVAIVRVLRHR